MTTNYNIEPYFDDFDSTKNYVKVLFKPGVSVQARELTQLQTAIQEQIKALGGFMFKNESLVSGGQQNQTKVDFIDVDTSTVDDITPFLDKKIISTSGAKAKVVYVENNYAKGVSRLYYAKLNAISIAAGEEITEDAVIPSTPTITTLSSIGNSILYTLEQSVFYVNGYFVVSPKQSIIVGDGSILPTAKVGLNVVEDIITYQDDESLLDNAIGAPNYAAPGADRVQIQLNLTTLPYDVVAEQNAENMVPNTDDNFIELARYVGGKKTFSLNAESLGKIEDILARRTYDESGDYTVKAFNVSAKKDASGDSSRLNLEISPGKAYVKGYEFETQSNFSLNLPKARELAEVSNRVTSTDYGDYFLINIPTGGVLDYTANAIVNIKAASTVIGTCQVYMCKRESATKLRLYVADIKLTAGALNTATSLENGAWAAAIDSANSNKLYTGKKNSFIVPIGFTPIKTLLDVSYITQAKLSAIASSTQLILTNAISQNKQFISTTPADYLIVNTVDSQIVNSGYTITITGNQSITVDGTFVSGNTYNIYAKISVASGALKSKTLTSATIYVQNSTAQSINLGVADAFRVVSITAMDPAGTNPATEVTSRYYLDNGQRDHVYDYATINLNTNQRSISTATHSVLKVELEYFASVQSAGYFSVNSYDSIDYADILGYKTKTGDYISLRDAFDFRSVRTAISLSTSIGSPLLPAAVLSSVYVGDQKSDPDQFITYDLEYYLSRIDKLILTKERRFDLISGIASIEPGIPTDIPDAMTLAIVKVPAYTFSPSQVSVQVLDNRRYTMRDIGKIEKRVERLEYYTSMSLLEKQASDEMVLDSSGLEKFKSGILVDPFVGFGVADIGSYEYSAAIDTQTKTLRPKFSTHNLEFEISPLTNRSDVNVVGDLVTLPYTTTPFVQNTLATSWVNLQPYMVFEWNGEMKLTPSTDTWSEKLAPVEVVVNVNGENDPFTILVDDVVNPASIGTKWDEHRLIDKGISVEDNSSSSTSTQYSKSGGDVFQTKTVTDITDITKTITDTYLQVGLETERAQISTITRDIGTKVTDASIIPHIRAKTIDFAASKMLPSVRLFASFDDVDVTRYCFSYPSITVTVPNGATRVKKVGSNKAADVVNSRSDRAYVKMDAGYALFSIGDSVEWLVNNAWVSGANSVQNIHYATENLMVDSAGQIAGYFMIPNNAELKFTTGEKLFRLADNLSKQAKTAAQTKYVAQGMSMSTQRDIVQTRVQQVALHPTSSLMSSVSVDKQYSIAQTVATSVVTVKCGELSSGSGKRGRFEYDLELGTELGLCGINYDPTGIPDRYTIIWNGQEYSSGFVGFSEYDKQLTDMGLPATVKFEGESYPASMSASALSSRGKLRFNKTEYLPSKAKLVVEAPLEGTLWEYKMVCPGKTDDMVHDAENRLEVNMTAPASITLVYGAQGNQWNTAALWPSWFPGLVWNGDLSAPTGGLWNSDVIRNYRANVKIGATEIAPNGTPVMLESLEFVESNRVVLTRPGIRSRFWAGWGMTTVATLNFDLLGGNVYSGDLMNYRTPRISINSGAMFSPSFPLEVKVGDTISIEQSLVQERFGFSPTELPSLTTNIEAFRNSWTIPAPGKFMDMQYKLISSLKFPVDGDVVRTTSIATTSYEVIRRDIVFVEQNWGNDPVAQTFVPSSTDYPSGLFIDSVDLYFRSKGTSYEYVTLQIRPTVNGFPSSKDVLPFATCVKYASDIVTSADATATKLATNFKLQAPVYLAPDVEYAIVAIPSSPDFEIFTTKLGEFSLSNPNVRSTTQPYLGSMFKSQNASTWTPEQNEDILMRINRCVFTQNVEKKLVLQTSIPTASESNSAIDYDLFYADGEVLDFADTNVNYSFQSSVRASNAMFSKDLVPTTYQLGNNTLIGTRKSLNLVDPNSLTFTCDMSTRNSAVSPVIDVNRMSAALIQNVVNSNTHAEDSSKLYAIDKVTGTTDTIVFRTTVTHAVQTGDQFSALLNIKQKISGVYTATAVTSNTITVTRQADGYGVFAESDDTGSIILRGQCYSKYVTRTVTLKPEFHSNDISVSFYARVPQGCDVVPMYRVALPSDNDITDETWHNMTLDYVGEPNTRGFREYKYRTTYVSGSEHYALPTQELFAAFAVKLLLTATDPSSIPLVKDLRVITLNG